MSPFSPLRRRIVALALCLAPAAALLAMACSSPESHPALLGDCSGKLCPPGQNQTIGSSSSSSSGDGGTTTDGGGGGTDDGGTDSGSTDSGLGGD